MKRRQKMRNHRLDNRVFGTTANRVNKKNLMADSMRGGIRL